MRSAAIAKTPRKAHKGPRQGLRWFRRPSRGFESKASIVASLILLIVVPGSSRCENSEAVRIEKILGHISQYVADVGTLEFVRTRTTEYHFLGSGDSQTTHQITRVVYNSASSLVDLEMIEPPEGAVPGMDEGGRVMRSQVLARVGMPLWILDIRAATGGCSLSLQAKAPPGFVVLAGKTPSRSGDGRRIWELLISEGQNQNRIVSGTLFYDSGQPCATFGIEQYTSFLGGKVLLPLLVRTRTFSTMSESVFTDEFASVAVRPL